MLWFLILHILSLLVWTAAVLYVPILVVHTAQEQEHYHRLPTDIGSLARLVFTHVASPAAIIAIIAGTLVFVVGEKVTFWLFVKLTLVSLMTASHASMGLLITRLERNELRNLKTFSWILFVLTSSCIVAVVWVVLAKPAIPEAFPWRL
ncbi:hypothetical protein CA267_018695 [Alteromonas pelagimontana]|uniref:Protoporphyrinogen IX oxidase n=1 Tax=Alteromonas pelagimontana TaxID=1858656 RepID=A0A6M4MKN2_9ALTE|nr:CopD family protein [Alteromonas pelagimontana]QJR82636.1 hypothetical protein CA267_018695 [Alteromonas pelagimontana]